MEERERIRQRRAAGKLWPWTKDEILRTYSFTNVMREYDRVSQWIQKEITDKYYDHPQLWIMLAIARQVNWPPALRLLTESALWPTYRATIGEEDVVESWTEIDATVIKVFRAILDVYQASGAKVYTGAYMIHADSDPRTSDIWLNKNHYVLGMVVGQLLGRTPPLGSLREFTKWMTQFESWGGFMAYEVACDLRWAPGWLDTAPDIYTWANPGPGAYRGLNVEHGRAFTAKVPEAQAVREMKELLTRAENRKWGVVWPRRLEMRDIEHSLCEAAKYHKVVSGLGRPRAKYQPPREDILC